MNFQKVMNLSMKFNSLFHNEILIMKNSKSWFMNRRETMVHMLMSAAWIIKEAWKKWWTDGDDFMLQIKSMLTVLMCTEVCEFVVGRGNKREILEHLYS